MYGMAVNCYGDCNGVRCKGTWKRYLLIPTLWLKRFPSVNLWIVIGRILRSQRIDLGVFMSIRQRGAVIEGERR